MAFKKYAEFKGRATRKEYWMFLLVHVTVALIVAFTESWFFAESTILSNLYGLLTFMPALAIGVRRLHDTGNTGWYILIPVANLVYLLMPTKKGKNEFGEEPTFTNKESSDHQS
jgi:uncharacterized membrane protein YhaH (DUF805 family)